MGKPAAKKGDQVVGVDTHILLMPPTAVPTPIPHPFVGMLQDKLSDNVKIMGQPAAVKGSVAKAAPPHIPQGGPFQKPPKNEGTVAMGSGTVKINGKDAARMGDPVSTCSDVGEMQQSKIIAVSTVMIGG